MSQIENRNGTYFPIKVRFTDTNEEVVLTHSQLYGDYQSRPFIVLQTRVRNKDY